MDTDRFLEGIGRKENKAWEELYRYFYAPLCSYSAKIIQDADAAEDIVQGALVALWQSTTRFADIKALTSYLYRSVYNASLNYMRDRQVEKQLHEDYAERLAVNETDATEMALEEEVITRFYEVLGTLPEQQREIIMRCMKGEKVKEIAEALSITGNSVKTQKKRAYQVVRDALEEGLAVVLPLLGLQW